MGHTLMEDRAITGKVKSRWIGLLPGKDQEAVRKVILQLMYDLFHLESYVISDAYGGEKFGRGVYHRLIYGNTVGKIMGIKTNKLNTLLMNSARYMARQFAEKVREHLPDMDGYELKEENLLTYEQFQDVFENEKLQVSLLFDTGEGYFSYCTVSKHPLKKGNVEPIRSHNAIAEVEKYLIERESRPKRKVLVVDDSATMRLGIKNLLEQDYDVALAQSGTAAFRCLILDKPDLVLLDYEMPVCDGRQVLEMVRSEETLADIPIIFLTGRADPETVKKLVALKPDGYLVKNLKPAQIKQKIDDYFEKKIL